MELEKEERKDEKISLSSIVIENVVIVPPVTGFLKNGNLYPFFQSINFSISPADILSFLVAMRRIAFRVSNLFYLSSYSNFTIR